MTFSLPGGTQVGCEYCGKRLLPRTLIVHQHYFCGPQAVRSEKLRKRQRKQDDANEKAMRTLRIKKDDESPAEAKAAAAAKEGGQRSTAAGNSKLGQRQRAQPSTARGNGSAAASGTAAAAAAARTPTLSNVYRELMQEAGRRPVGMYERI